MIDLFELLKDHKGGAILKPYLNKYPVLLNKLLNAQTSKGKNVFNGKEIASFLTEAQTKYSMIENENEIITSIRDPESMENLLTNFVNSAKKSKAGLKIQAFMIGNKHRNCAKVLKSVKDVIDAELQSIIYDYLF